jgi:hypothetical protein
MRLAAGRADAYVPGVPASRSHRTAYYLDRELGFIALIARGVRLPATEGTWVPVADGDLAPWEATSLLSLVFPDVHAHELPFAALLNDVDVEDFEREHPRDASRD